MPRDSARTPSSQRPASRPQPRPNPIPRHEPVIHGYQPKGDPTKRPTNPPNQGTSRKTFTIIDGNSVAFDRIT